ncbi:TPA: DEAD/DEAH box helicase [Klebsiella pneumoniae]|uniref:DEAD/DEAH box helicase n=1 Tax=Klebsiella pneumoniae TaxID=573 RepID=UPI0020CB90C7|nr:ATP-binding domain-containing protein [Klebsiella pneumoniae]MCQ0659002.1 ATP-binding domain-containing protein [Klebsiella pneumoniae]MCS7607142.1 ATP-binding domain-containing protein [Pseudomonas aeruginosa]HCQ9068300.1 DEAD/DEAH box helicase [Klebsiella pneumoniae]HCQ9159418.1 DEAD/DEAH box helicase [Klebsiella pneumoniae]
MTERLNITRGVNKKPVATDALEQSLEILRDLQGDVFTGYPLIATPDGKYSIDATLVSPSKGIVLFDLIEGPDVGEYAERQDDLANKIEARLKLHRELVKGRQLLVPLSVISFAPGINNIEAVAVENYPLVNEHGLAAALNELSWVNGNNDLYRMTLSAIESLSSIRKSRSKREVHRLDSRGAKLKRLEDSIATLDHRQNKAVIETVDGVQRIRGLAGSGKTIVLALKAAYLHTQYPDWRIAVTFHTRSLKGQFRRLINNFCIEQSGEEPDWTKIRIINAWGAPGGDARDGIYYEYCRATGTEFLDFRNASGRFGGNERAFDGACQAALANASDAAHLYDVILADEAQDFAPSFLKLCYSMLKPPKRLVYAYDELQNLSGTSLPPPEEIFGNDAAGRPLVTFGDDRRRDVILQKCYRNSRPVLVSAHGLGFGIYREAPQGAPTGLVQMFDYPALWEEIGYKVKSGQLAKGQHIVLERTAETSPRFLEEHSDINDLVHFIKFDDEAQQNAWLVQQIQSNLTVDELRHDDIIVIHSDPRTARGSTGPIRRKLFEAGVQTHLAGVDTDADVFFRTDTPSVTFTGIYRAKGNEAGMVYVINAQDCNGSGPGLSSLRNRLFTAITRSKAWVRVIGYGPRMQELIEEFNALKQSGFVLDFTYPDEALLSKLRIVHRDLSPQERQRLEKRKSQLADLLGDLESGELHPEDLDDITREKLKKLLGGA